MPELPEVETVRRGLVPALEGARIVAVEKRRDKLRFAFPERFAERLTGTQVTAVGRRAKYLVIDLSSGEVLIVHLGMTGSFRIEGEAAIGSFRFPRGKDVAHDHVVFHLDNGLRVVFNDPRRFGLMDLCRRDKIEGHPLLAGLGIEPTGNALDGAMLARLLAGKAAPLKAALLDQRLIAGLGNIYVAEALHRAHLSPRRRAGTIARKDGRTSERAERLATAIREVIAEAIAAGGSTLNDYIRVDGELGYFQHSFRVYDREGEPCRTPGCGGTVKRIVQSGRSTFWCPTCQR